VTTVACGTNPYALAVDEGATPHKTYVGNWNSDNVTVIDEPAASPALSMLGVSEAHAADSVLVTIDPDLDTSGGTAVARGTATSMRPVYPAAISAVFYRVAPGQTWRRASITQGEFTTDIEWEADLGSLADGTYDIEVMAIDQTSATAATSDGGSAVSAAAAGGSAQATFDIGAEEPHATVTELAALPPQPPKKTGPALEATVYCAEPGCAGPTGQIVLERYVGPDWELVGEQVLDAGQASWVLDKKDRGEFRVRYLGDEQHEASTSESAYVGPPGHAKP
jgi:hypothetical protein